MKSKLLISLGLLITAGITAQVPQQKLYINLNSHNEVNNEAYDGSTNMYYMTYYPLIKELSDSVISKKARWNFQSDVRFLLGAIKWDPKTLSNTVSGNNLNLLKWMDDSYYIECDPHSHEGNYPSFGTVQMNYADCAHLHDSLGVTNRKNVGGFKWDGLQNGSDWQDFEAGMPCVTYSWAPAWKPNVLWGGSYSTGVHNDLNSYGEWKPSGNTTSTYFTPDNNRRVRCQGNGCELHFTDTTADSRITANLRSYATAVVSGTFPAGQFYTQSIQIDCRDFNKTNFITRVCAILDSANQLVAEGKAIWGTITQKDSIWLNELDSMAYISDCNTVTSSTQSGKLNNANDIRLSPNPASNRVLLSTPNADKITVKIINSGGQEKKSLKFSGATSYDLDVKELPKGIYTLLITDEWGFLKSKRLIISG